MGLVRGTSRRTRTEKPNPVKVAVEVVSFSLVLPGAASTLLTIKMSGERDQLIASMIKTLKRCRAENNSNRPEEADKLMQEVVAAAEKYLALSGPQTSPRVDLQNSFLVLDSDVSDNESAGARYLNFHSVFPLPIRCPSFRSLPIAHNQFQSKSERRPGR